MRTNPGLRLVKVRSGSDAGNDRLYIGTDDFAQKWPRTATEQSLDAGLVKHLPSPPPVLRGEILLAKMVLTVPVAHRDGTVYAVCGWRDTDSTNRVTSDVVSRAMTTGSWRQPILGPGGARSPAMDAGVEGHAGSR